MPRQNADPNRLALLRDELLARNQIERLRSRGEPPSDLLNSRLREASLSSLLEKLSNETSIVNGDGRGNLQSAPPEVQDMGASVALICSKLDLVEPVTPQTEWKLNSASFLCSGQNFDTELGVLPRDHIPATGFLVGASGRHLLTARHAALDDYGRLRKDLHCVFGYRQEGTTTVRSFSSSDVIPVLSLVEWGRGEGEDWALVDLVASAGRAGLPLRASGVPTQSDPVIAIGHPHGLPVKTGTGILRDVSSTRYLADLDISPGNSGSPVIAVDGSGKPLHVEGIIVEALDDLMYVYERECSVWVNAPDLQVYWASFVPIAKVLADASFQKAVFP